MMSIPVLAVCLLALAAFIGGAILFVRRAPHAAGPSELSAAKEALVLEAAGKWAEAAAQWARAAQAPSAGTWADFYEENRQRCVAQAGAARAHTLSSLQQEAEDVILAQLDQRTPDPAAGAGDGEDEPLSEAYLQAITEVHRRCCLEEGPEHDTCAHVHRGELLREVRRLQALVRQAEDRGTRLLFEQARELETERDAVQAQLAELQRALQAQTGPKGAT